MSRESEDELTSTEREALADLRKRTDVPPALESRVVTELRRRGLVRGGRSSRRAWRAALLVAGLAGAFFLGTLVTRERTPVAAGTDTTDRFLLLLYSPESEWGAPGDRRVIDEYAAWARDARERGLVETGDKLEWSGYLLQRDAAGIRQAEAPAGDSPRSLGGYFIIRAESYDSALAIAAECPHVLRGGEVELRRIERL